LGFVGGRGLVADGGEAGRNGCATSFPVCGFAAARHCAPVANADLERFAIALCGRTDDHALFQQALIIAENELVLRTINQQQLAVIERLRDPSVPAFSQRDNSLQLMRARFRKSKQAEKAIKALRDALLEKYDHRLPPSFAEDSLTGLDALFPWHLRELLEKLETKQRRALLAARYSTSKTLIAFMSVMKVARSRQQLRISSASIAMNGEPPPVSAAHYSPSSISRSASDCSLPRQDARIEA
jgi:hypothetical protein